MRKPMTDRRWCGVFPAATTQFREDQTLDLDATARHWQVLIDSGISGLIVGGSLGENQTLEADEKRLLVAEAVTCAAGRVPVLSGVAEMSTAAACRYVRDCEKLGAGGVLGPDQGVITRQLDRVGRGRIDYDVGTVRDAAEHAARKRAASTEKPCT